MKILSYDNFIIYNFRGVAWMTIKIYTTSHCHYCNMAKEFFRKIKVKYQEINVEKDEKAAEEMIEKSGQLGVPVIDIEGQIIVGFDRNAIQSVLKRNLLLSSWGVLNGKV